ncbi:hypothetical protein D0865_08070 [Hortaea werneckii]|uniref:Uncharacterized protein n=2 Tax=Hortaea werneckii TaxID=91943 RepID=A0A3M7CVP8_HORWE|nr:hypothetical protein D0865_08070 [Hortaea werneckii]RMY55746.1 hypothetical protein D0863_13209 [Hortaea werneckii]
MSSSAVAKKPEEQVAQPAAGQSMQASEQSASASASAGLNLNLVGAVTGLFSSKSKKEEQPDGSSVEHKDEQAHIKGKPYIGANTQTGAGAGNMQALGAANAESKDRRMKVQNENE